MRDGHPAETGSTGDSGLRFSDSSPAGLTDVRSRRYGIDLDLGSPLHPFAGDYWLASAMFNSALVQKKMQGVSMSFATSTTMTMEQRFWRD